jgi:hypothetical protein
LRDSNAAAHWLGVSAALFSLRDTIYSMANIKYTVERLTPIVANSTSFSQVARLTTPGASYESVARELGISSTSIRQRLRRRTGSIPRSGVRGSAHYAKI